jgi:hypothetical protein
MLASFSRFDLEYAVVMKRAVFSLLHKLHDRLK